MFEVPADRSRKNYFFEVAALLHEVLERIAVRDSYDVLFDDGAVIQHFGDVVSGRAEQFDAALERLVMRLGADKRGQK